MKVDTPPYRLSMSSTRTASNECTTYCCASDTPVVGKSVRMSITPATTPHTHSASKEMMTWGDGGEQGR